MGENRKSCLDLLTEYLECNLHRDPYARGKAVKEAPLSAEQVGEIESQYSSLMQEVSQGDISILEEYADALIEIKKKRRDLWRYARKVLTSKESLKGLLAARKKITELYPILDKLNKEFTISDYYEISLDPDCYLYGASFVRSQGEQVDREPRSNETIQGMLELFIQMKDSDRTAGWIMSILLFAPESIIEKYRKNYTGLREDLRTWTWKQVFDNKKYKWAVSDRLFKKKGLKELVDNQIRLVRLNDRQHEIVEENKELRAKVKEFEEQKEREHNEEQNTVKRLNDTIRECNLQIKELEDKVRDVSLTKQLLDTYVEKYQTQIGINERVVRENDRRVEEIEEKNRELVNKKEALEEKLEMLTRQWKALESDYNLTKNELGRMREADRQRENIVRRSILGEMISGLNEQLFYLTCFYNDLHENGMLEPEGVELFADTLNSIDRTLSRVGVQKIGTIDQIVKYDSSIHSSSDAGVSNGDEVIVSGYGWKIGDEIYIKAPVEKGNE